MAITFATSIPALLLYHPSCTTTTTSWGRGTILASSSLRFLEVLHDLEIGVAIVMFPILRRKSESLALGYVASRIVESTMIVRWPHQPPSDPDVACSDLAASVGGNGGSLLIAGRSLVAIHEWTFVFGPGFCVGVNDILLGYLMYSTGLMPQRLALFGLIGGPLIFASKIAVVFGAYRKLAPRPASSRFRCSSSRPRLRST